MRATRFIALMLKAKGPVRLQWFLEGGEWGVARTFTRMIDDINMAWGRCNGSPLVEVYTDELGHKFVRTVGVNKQKI